MPDSKKRITIPDLKSLGKNLAQIDQHIVSVAATRMDLATLVEQRKRLEESNQPIIRREVETRRLEQVAGWAEEFGINPQFAQSIQYLMMAEACRVQMENREFGLNAEEEQYTNGSKEDWYDYLRQNLLALTEDVAPVYDQMYASAPFATRSYLAYETNIIKREIETVKALNNTGKAIDLGCATGRIAFQFSPHFQEVAGYDISPAMIQVAQDNLEEYGYKNVNFCLADIEEHLPIENNSVSLAIMNLGTASDILNTKSLLANLKNILKKDGRFILSFYNQNALYYRNFVPWQLPLTAAIDPIKHCLNVKREKRDYLVHARPYSEKEVEQLVEKSGLKLVEITSYPTVTSILPNEFFTDQNSEVVFSKIDDRLVKNGAGAYLLVVGKKID